MQILLLGLFKPGALGQLSRWQMEWNEHLAQQPLRIAGPLLEESGDQRGWMAVLTAASLEEATAFLHSSPYFKADLFDRLEVFQMALEVGRLG